MPPPHRGCPHNREDTKRPPHARQAPIEGDDEGKGADRRFMQELAAATGGRYQEAAAK